MSLGSYLKDKLALLFSLGIAVAASMLLLWVLQVGIATMVAVGTLLIGAIAVGCVWDYLPKRRFYSDLRDVLDKTEGEAYYVTELIHRPQFSEGVLLHDLLARATKDMNDHIAVYRHGAEEYQEYIETWIHEVKTPLAASHLILNNYNDLRLRQLEYELEKIEAYVEQTLFYARSTAIEKDFAIKQVQLDVLVQTAVKKHAHVLIEKGIMPYFENLKMTVYTDPKWLDFILGQIIINSARYAQPSVEVLEQEEEPEGHPSLVEQHTYTTEGEQRATCASVEPPRIMFFAELKDSGHDRHKVVLTITDNGIGIPAHDVPRVFKKGFTGENGRRFAKTTGIGLYLCKRLCASMKLDISLDSREQEGTTVAIEFPLNKMYFLE